MDPIPSRSAHTRAQEDEPSCDLVLPPPPQPLPQLLFSRDQAAQMLSIHVNTVDAAVREKRLRPARKGRRVLFHLEELDRFARLDIPGFHQNGPALRLGKKAS